jgi:hypothetical protein
MIWLEAFIDCCEMSQVSLTDVGCLWDEVLADCEWLIMLVLGTFATLHSPFEWGRDSAVLASSR